MAVVISSYVHQAKIDKAVKKIERALKPDVVRIRYSFADNFMGDPSVYFRVVLSDEAAEDHQLHANAQRVRQMISDEIAPWEIGLESYVNVRSASEQEESRNPLWE